MNEKELKVLLLEEAAYYDAQMNEIKLKIYSQELSGVSEFELKRAIKILRMQVGRRQMPMPSEYLAQIPDGHLSANESWAMIPRNEDDSVVWSEEMRLAYASAAPLIREGNFTSAFFAYKETYERLVAEARLEKRKPKWSPSFGFNKSGREAAIIQAVEKNRITLEIGLKYAPELEYNPNYEQLLIAHGKEKIQLDYSGITRINKLITTTEK